MPRVSTAMTSACSAVWSTCGPSDPLFFSRTLCGNQYIGSEVKPSSPLFFKQVSRYTLLIFPQALDSGSLVSAFHSRSL